MSNFYHDLVEHMQAKRKLIIARIIRQEGSAPRTTGTKCLLLEDGSIEGTIGGGLLEFQVMAGAKKVFNQEKSDVIHFQLTGKELAGSEMLCGGKVDVYLEPVNPENSTALNVFKTAADAVSQGRSGYPPACSN